MAKKQGLELEQRQRMRLSLQQLRYVKLLELNAPELESAVERELEENPALEATDAPSEAEKSAEMTEDGSPFEESSEELQRNDYDDDDLPPAGFTLRRGAAVGSPEFTPADSDESLYDILNQQIDQKALAPLVAETAHYIIGSLDSNGYLRRGLEAVVDDMAFGPGIAVDMNTAREALEAVQSLEPAGVGATDLRDCLLLQLRRLPASQERDDATAILTDEFEEFALKHTHRLVSNLRIPERRIKQAIELIVSLNPKPGATVGTSASDRSMSIIPDFFIDNTDGEITISLNNSVPELRIDESFADAVRRMKDNAATRAARKGNDFILNRYNDARDFIRLLRQRNETLFAVMTAIVQIQRDYFLSEDQSRLRPMMIKDISALTGYDISVISRATANKYAATPWGIFPLRYFFTESYNDEEGEEMFTRRQVEQEMRALVDAEDKRHPLSDENLRELLAAKGFDVSRRTVAKYRDLQGIPVARLRKEM